MGFKGRVIGLTGNIACGKSAVARLLSELGVPVIDADQVAREVTGPGSPTLEPIVAAFGPDVLDSKGQLDRKKVRDLIFRDEARRRKLEAILHPAIQQRSLELFQRQFQAGKPLVVYEATLLVESGRYRDFDGLLVVTCSPDTQRARLLARDKSLTAELAEQIIASQMPQEDKARLATWVLDNDGTQDQLTERVRAWYAANVSASTRHK